MYAVLRTFVHFTHYTHLHSLRAFTFGAIYVPGCGYVRLPFTFLHARLPLLRLPVTSFTHAHAFTLFVPRLPNVLRYFRVTDAFVLHHDTHILRTFLWHSHVPRFPFGDGRYVDTFTFPLLRCDSHGSLRYLLPRFTTRLRLYTDLLYIYTFHVTTRFDFDFTHYLYIHSRCLILFTISVTVDGFHVLVDVHDFTCDFVVDCLVTFIRTLLFTVATFVHTLTFTLRFTFRLRC